MDSKPDSPLGGLLPVLQLPYRADASIDWDDLWQEVEWLLAHGSDGLVVAMVTEVLRLTESERRDLTERLCAYVGGRVPVVVSVGAESSKAAAALARHAQDAGAAAVMAIPPIATACSGDEVWRYYQQIIDATHTPVIIQDASGYVGRPIPTTLQAELFKAFGPRIMFKPEAPPLGQNMSALHEATGGRATVFEGSGGIALVDCYRRGISGTMPGSDLIRIIGPLWRSLEAGRDEDVWRIATALAPLLSNLINLDAYLAVEKHLLVRQGVFKLPLVRGPVGYVLDAHTRGEVDRLFDRALAVAQDVSENTTSLLKGAV